jgi:hypothetical protein
MNPSVWPRTLRAIVADYRESQADRDTEITWWQADGVPFDQVIERVARADLRCGKRQSHQRRLGRATIEACLAALRGIRTELQAAVNFDEILTLVGRAFASVQGAGELATYDAADRICLHRGIAPEQVYLHAGTRDGFRQLSPGPRRRGHIRSVQRGELPLELRGLTERELEDVLCIYKDFFLYRPEEFAREVAKRGGCYARPRNSASCARENPRPRKGC